MISASDKQLLKSPLWETPLWFCSLKLALLQPERDELGLLLSTLQVGHRV